MRTTVSTLRAGLAAGAMCLAILAGCGTSTSGAIKRSGVSKTTSSVAAGPTSTAGGSPSTTAAEATSTTEAAESTTTATATGGVITDPSNRWTSSATAYNDKPAGTKVRFTCPASGEPSSVWGSGTYTADSSVCTAAVHFGTITLAKGGTVVIETAGGLPSYIGSEGNGITTSDWGQYAHSFTISDS